MSFDLMAKISGGISLIGTIVSTLVYLYRPSRGVAWGTNLELGCFFLARGAVIALVIIAGAVRLFRRKPGLSFWGRGLLVAAVAGLMAEIYVLGHIPVDKTTFS